MRSKAIWFAGTVFKLDQVKTNMGKHIHIIDDDPVVKNLLTASLKKRGFEVSGSDDAYHVFDLSDNMPDLFILDVVLPGLNGLEICKWIKSLNKKVQVLLLSATPGLKVLASDSGADEYLEKPFQFDTLVSKIHHCFVKQATDDLAEADY
jgi:two-component system, OmpR family, response regulator CssR